jgi:uncharacterized protein YecE (DUF72 family)
MSEKRYSIGCQSWGYDDWVTKADGPTVFYPRGTKQGEMLEQYARLIETVEVDSTAYGTPPASTFEGWLEKVPEGFTFSLKVPRLITHEYSLDDRALPVFDEFCERSLILGKHLGLILIQLPASFESNKANAQRLRTFIARLPERQRFALEFREPGWFVNWTFEELNEAGVALAMVEGPWVDRQIMFDSMAHLQTAHSYIRLMGERDLVKFDRVYRNRDEVIKQWAENLDRLRPDDVFVYTDNHFEGHAPGTANKLKRMLGLPEHEPAAIETQSSLF